MPNLEGPFPLDPRDLKQSGFKSSAAEYIGQVLSLDKLLIKNPAATFFWRAWGYEYKSLGIRNGAILIVDRSLKAQHDSTVVCIFREEFRIRRLRRWGDHLVPVPLRDSTKLDPLEAVEVWGVLLGYVNITPDARRAYGL